MILSALLLVYRVQDKILASPTETLLHLPPSTPPILLFLDTRARYHDGGVR